MISLDIYELWIQEMSLKIEIVYELIMAAKNKVLEIFKNTDKPLRPGEVAEKTGIESKEVSKIIKELREEGKVYSPKRCYYALK